MRQHLVGILDGGNAMRLGLPAEGPQEARHVIRQPKHEGPVETLVLLADEGTLVLQRLLGTLVAGLVDAGAD